MPRHGFGLLAGLLLLACACEPEATPLPVNLPTLPPATATEAPPQRPRYAVAPDTLPYLTDQDRSLISASADIVPLDAPPAADDLGTRYEIVVALGDLPDSTPAPTPLQVSLSVNTALPPLDDPALADIVRRAADPQQIVAALGIPGAQAATAQPGDPLALRGELANAGYPDGFDVTLAAFAPGADALANLLGAIGIQARVVTSTDEPAHLTLTTAQDANAIPLLTIPIRYRAVEGLTITFTPSGFPIVQRSQ